MWGGWGVEINKKLCVWYNSFLKYPPFSSRTPERKGWCLLKCANWEILPDPPKDLPMRQWRKPDREVSTGSRGGQHLCPPLEWWRGRKLGKFTSHVPIALSNSNSIALHQHSHAVSGIEKQYPDWVQSSTAMLKPLLTLWTWKWFYSWQFINAKVVPISALSTQTVEVTSVLLSLWLCQWLDLYR